MKKYPFKFLDSYDQNDTDIFFGRDEEIKALYEMVFQSSILLVYGTSGTGKTSLIQCGLAGKFKLYDWLALTIRRGNNIIASLEKVLLEAGGDYATAKEVKAESAEAVLTGFPKLIHDVYLNHFKPVYLIFDQFEELYILGNKEEQGIFIKAIKDILASGQNVKLIFSIREEYLGHLYDFERAVPQLLRKKLRVEPMNIDKVTDMLTGINNNKNSLVSIKEDEIRAITEGIFNRLQGSKKSLTIQLPYLQVFFDKLYLEITNDNTRQTEALITNATLLGMGTIGDVLRDFLESQVKSICEKNSVPGKKVLPETIWKILSPFSTLEGTKKPILVKDLQDQLKKDANINEALVIDCIKEFEKGRILKPTETPGQYELAHDSLAKCIAEKRSDEDIALLQISQIIKNQVATKADAREPFTEKQLIFFKPYLPKLILNEEEEKLIKESIKAVAKRKRNRIAILLLIFTGLIIALVYVWHLYSKTEQSYNDAKAAKINADTNAARANRAQIFADTNAARAYRAKVLADTNEKIAGRALIAVQKSAVQETKAKEKAKDSEKKALKALNEIRIKNLRNAASEYSRLIHDGPSEDNGNTDKFYGSDYFLAYTYHFNCLDDSLQRNDPVYRNTTYKSLQNKLYYDNELYSRIYDDFASIKLSDSVIREVKDFTFTNPENDPVFKAHKAKTGLNYFAFARSKKSDLAFCATDDNSIYVYEGAKKVAEISMGAKVTALDYNDGKSIIYFGTSGGYIGYIIYDANSKKLQPVFKNKLESEITAIQYFEYRDNPKDKEKTNHFLLAAARTSNTCVYKVDEKSLQPDIHLIGNELPFKKEYVQIETASFDGNGKIILKTKTSKGKHYSWNPFTYDLLEKLKEKKGFDPASAETKTLIIQPDIKFYQ